MKLHSIEAPKPNQKTRKRVGRGEGSGLGQQSGRGHKGQKAGSGYSKKIGFEGGQMPLQRRIPKFGFKNPFRVDYDVVNLDRLAQAIELGKLSHDITKEQLISSGLASGKKKIKVLGQGDLTAAINIEADKFSKSAEEKITASGGSVKTV